ncbi:thioredoxin domain-containing protein [Bifidobacterium sp. ESL0763]|uniref:DsbA family protein n=1 Tax=Bifidobacterium sp. ESL0763 TaxID=2983227 RepID=UPI0023F92C77|nr:DsbA family protein [Bifidobacterium sp. ESL0763]MDF7663607.1 thioredoxin domain-containing protein [Bifidobacterium sp. ESL0763]
MGSTNDSNPTNEAPKANETDDSSIDIVEAAAGKGEAAANGGQPASGAPSVPQAAALPRQTSSKLIKAIFAIIAAILVVVIVLAAGYGYWNKQHGLKHSYDQLQSLATKPARTTKQGGVPAFTTKAYNAQAPDVDLYVDFLCPNCANLDQKIAPTLKKLQSAGQINLYIHPLTFLDHNSKHHYSVRAASAFTYVAAHEPGKALDFASALFEKNYQPSRENGRDVSDQQIVAQALKAGVSRDVATHATDGTYKDFAQKANDYTIQRKELFVDIRGEHRFSTPTICINGTMWRYRRLHTLQDVAPTLIQSLGLKESQVGDKTVMPSIGHYHKALPIAKKFL